MYMDCPLHTFSCMFAKRGCSCGCGCLHVRKTWLLLWLRLPERRTWLLLAVVCSAAWLQVATAIRGAIILAKMSVIPVRRGYWGNKIGKVHTVPTKVTGKCGSVTIRLIPAPRGAGTLAIIVDKLLTWGC
jgi:hypothetical protein